MIKEGQLYRTGDGKFKFRGEKVRGGIVYVLVLHTGKVQAMAIPDENFQRHIVKGDFVLLEKGQSGLAHRDLESAARLDPSEKDKIRNESIEVLRVNEPVQG